MMHIARFLGVLAAMAVALMNYPATAQTPPWTNNCYAKPPCVVPPPSPPPEKVIIRKVVIVPAPEVEKIICPPGSSRVMVYVRKDATITMEELERRCNAVPVIQQPRRDYWRDERPMRPTHWDKSVRPKVACLPLPVRLWNRDRKTLLGHPVELTLHVWGVEIDPAEAYACGLRPFYCDQCPTNRTWGRPTASYTIVIRGTGVVGLPASMVDAMEKALLCSYSERFTVPDTALGRGYAFHQVPHVQLLRHHRGTPPENRYVDFYK